MNDEQRDDDRIDFSALDPRREPRRWEAMVQHTLSRSTPPSVWGELASTLPRARLTLAALAAVAVLTWLPALLRPEGADVQQNATTTTATALAVVHFHEGGDLTAMLESADGY